MPYFVGVALLCSPASAATSLLGFGPGNCLLDISDEQISITRCENGTDLTGNDLYLTFSHRRLPDRLLEFSTGHIASRGLWQPEPDPVIWTLADLTSGSRLPTLGIRVSGYWTIDGKAVPEPSTWAMLLLGFLMLGRAVRHSRRRVATVPQPA